MPNYKVRYKVAAEPDSNFWLVGPHPNKETALAWFNSGDARTLALGQFKFDDPDCYTPTDYYLVEGNDEVFFALIQDRHEQMESYEVLEMQERRLKEGITSLEEQLEPLKSGRMHLEKDPNGEKTKREIARFEASIAEKQAKLKVVQAKLNGEQR